MKNKCNFHRKVIKIQNLAGRFNGRFKWLKRNSVKWQRVDKKIFRISKNQSSTGTEGWTVCAKTQRTEDGRGKPCVCHRTGRGGRAAHWQPGWFHLHSLGCCVFPETFGARVTGPKELSHCSWSPYSQISPRHTMLLVFQVTCHKHIHPTLRSLCVTGGSWCFGWLVVKRQQLLSVSLFQHLPPWVRRTFNSMLEDVSFCCESLPPKMKIWRQ